MYIVKSLLITIFIFISSNSFSQNHNKIETDLERVKKDIIDLQKFVYQNKSDTVSSSNNLDLSKINSQIELLLEKFISIEKQMIDMKDDITNLYQLYTSPQFDQNKKITSSNNLNIEESSSNLVVEKSNEEPSTQDLSITQSNVNKADEANSVEDLPKQTLGKLSISSLDDQKIINSGTQEDLIVNVGDRVFFEFDSSELTVDAQSTLDAQVAWLMQYSDTNITIEGHADERGTREYNLALGDKRAFAVYSYLAQAGIDTNRMEYISWGKERPEVIGSDETAYSQNRRSVTIVTN